MTPLFQIPIGARTISVIEAPEAEMKDASTDGSENFGLFCQLPTPRILISEKYTERGLTLIHEIIEAINETYDLNFSETQIRVLEQSLSVLLFSSEHLENIVRFAATKSK